MPPTLCFLDLPPYPNGATGALVLLAVIVAALAVQRIIFALALRAVRGRNGGLFSALLERAQAPAGFALPLIAALSVVPDLRITHRVDLILLRAVQVGSIIAVAWAIIATIGLYTDLMKRRYRLDVEDNLRARQVETRMDILARATITIIVVVTFGLGLMTFPSIRAIGTTLLASAGAAGIVVGLAARPFFENLIAGIQIALTQPIRLDDVVIVEGEYGRIERIAETYVVVALWDRRSMVLPLTYFIEKPFQNWTRTGAALLGTVFLYVDYTIPVDAIRQQLTKVLADEKLWDGNVAGVQMTDAKEATVEIRVLVSARNSPQLFDLRCNVREKLVAWLQATHPQSLPVVRQLTVVTGADAALRETAGALE